MATFYKIPAGWTLDVEQSVGGCGVEVNLVGADVRSVSLQYGIPTAVVKHAYKLEMQKQTDEQLAAEDVVQAPKTKAEEDKAEEKAEEASKPKAKKGKK